MTYSLEVGGSDWTRVNDHWKAHLRLDQLNYPSGLRISLIDSIKNCKKEYVGHLSF